MVEKRVSEVCCILSVLKKMIREVMIELEIEIENQEREQSMIDHQIITDSNYESMIILVYACRV